MDIHNAWLNNQEIAPAADESFGINFVWFFSYYLPPGSAGGS